MITIVVLLSTLLVQDDRPDILFILTDDHRPDAMGCYGNPAIRTPHFDSIAAEGVRLDAFYVAAPLCCPSRAAFLTGRHPHENGVMTNDGRDPDASLPTVATLLGKAGYATGFVGKAHLGGDPRKWGFAEAPLWLPAGASPHRNPKLMVDGTSKVVEGEITPIFTDAAIAWLEKHKGERWFLWFATTAPHYPYVRDPRHAYDKAKIPAPPLWPKGEPLSDHDWAGYYSTISMLDEQVGRILAKLKELGRLDRTLIVVAGDNGFMHGSHKVKAKSVWYEESARVPALLRWPAKIKAGTTSSALVSSVDLLPTLVEVAGAKPPEGLEGRSMLPLLAGGKPTRDRIFQELDPKQGGFPTWRMVRWGTFKFVKLDDDTEYLFDLATDPHEKKDLVDDEAHAETAGKLREMIRVWRGPSLK